MFFTLFVILPNEDISSLRGVESGSSIKDVRKILELSAGLPGQIYGLACSDGKVLEDDFVLELERTVWDGFVVRAVFHQYWQKLYDSVVENDLNTLTASCSTGGDNAEHPNGAKERGVVALFLASFFGLTNTCEALLCCDGVDPDGQTPFGRTALFAAMCRDHLPVMELLLSYSTSLHSKDVDGASPVDTARRFQSRDCLRKVRHLKLYSRDNSASSSRPSTEARPQRSVLPSAVSVIRIPNADAEYPALVTNDKDVTVTPFDASSCKSDLTPRPSQGKVKNGVSIQEPKQASGSRPSPKSLFTGSQLYTWDNNLRSASRASSAAGTQVRIPVPCISKERMSSGRTSRASTTHGVSWNDTMSVSPRTVSRLLPVTVHDLALTGSKSVLRISSLPQADSKVGQKSTQTDMNKTVLKDCTYQEDSILKPFTESLEQPHAPSQEPPERPPSRLDVSQELSNVGDSQVPEGYVINPEPHVSLEETSQENGPTMTKREDTVVRIDMQTMSRMTGAETDPSRTLISRDRISESPGRVGSQQAKSRRKQQATWQTMKRRLKLAEDQKRKSAPKEDPNTKSDENRGSKTTYQQWLARKRREKERQENSSDEESSAEEDSVEKSAENAKAFNDWLKDLKERPLRGPHPFTPASLHRRKTRPLTNLIQVGGNMDYTVPPPDPDTYMTAYKEWRRANEYTDVTELQSLPQNLKEAKRRVEEKRRSLLAMALTYEDWLEHSEQRQKLMQAILRADADKLAAIEQQVFVTRRAPRQISFDQWRERVEKREAEIRIEKQQKGTEVRQDKNGFLLSEPTRSSAAIAHEDWLRMKKEQSQRNKLKKNMCADSRSHTEYPIPQNGHAMLNGHAKGTNMHTNNHKGSRQDSEDAKHAAWESWLAQKHQKEMEQLSQHINKEKQLLFNFHQQKPSRVTQC